MSNGTVNRNVQIKVMSTGGREAGAAFHQVKDGAEKAGKAVRGLNQEAPLTTKELAKMWGETKAKAAETATKVQALTKSIQELGLKSREVRDMATQIGKQWGLAGNEIEKAIKKARMGSPEAMWRNVVNRPMTEELRNKLAENQQAAGGFMGMLPGGMLKKFAPAALAYGAASVGGDLLSGLYARQEGMPLQRSDLGMVGGFFSGMYDKVTGREIKQRRIDMDIENARNAEERMRGIRAAFGAVRAERYGLQRPLVTQMDTPGIRPQDIAAQIGRQARGEGEAATHYRQVADDFSRQADNLRLRGAPSTQIDAALQKEATYRKEVETSTAIQKQLLLDQLNIIKAINQAQVDRISGLREQFAALNPLERDRAISIGQKIKAGGTLTQTEFEEAAGLPGVGELLRRQQIETDNRTGAFNDFLGAVGRPEDVALIDRARRMTLQRQGAQGAAFGSAIGGGALGTVDVRGIEPVPVRVELAINEDELARAIMNQLNPLLDRVKVQVQQQAQNQERQEGFERQRQLNQGAAFQGPR